MVPVGSRPILWHIMKLYAHYGHKEFILCLGYKGEVIKDYFRNYHWNTNSVTLRLGRTPKITYHSQHDEEDWTVTLLETGLETQTGGRLRRALPFVESETLFHYSID
jgi:glucose-1-phosphate cytidylyltransferase